MKKVKVGKSKIHGNGLFADEPIKRGDVIELVHTIRELEPGVIKTTPTLLGRNYNHSEDSNALNVVDGNNRYLVALKEIEVGGEITTDYKTNPDLEQPDSFTSNDNYISFDYDDTLTTPEGFKLAQQMNKEGKNLYVITARDKVTPQMIERAEAAGIPKENIITAGSDEAKVRIIKENNINKHIDNKDSVIKALGDKGELFVPDAYPDLKADFVEMDLSDDDLNKLKEGGFIIDQYPDGGESKNNRKFKERLMKRYPGMQGVYGAEGENLNIVKDPNYDARSAGYGDIEFTFPGDDPVLNYPNLVEEGGPDYNYPNPSPDKYTALYNPRGANRGDIFLDMMHGMRDDPNYQPLLQNFEKAVRDARGEDMDWYYDQQVKEGSTQSKERYDENYIDSQLRAELAPGSIGMFSKGRRDYRKDRKYDSPEMRTAAKDVRNYLKGEYQDGGEQKIPWNPDYPASTTYEFQPLSPEQIAQRNFEQEKERAIREQERLMQEQENWTPAQWAQYRKQKDLKKYQQALIDEPKYFDEGRQFVSDWHNSPMYNKMVLNSYMGNAKDAAYITKLRQQNIASMPKLNIVNSRTTKYNSEAPAAWADHTQVEVFPGGFGTGPSLYVHEGLHVSDTPKLNFQPKSYSDPRFPKDDAVWLGRLMPASDQMYMLKNRAANYKDNSAYDEMLADSGYKIPTDEEIKQEVISEGISSDNPNFDEYFNKVKNQYVNSFKVFDQQHKRNWQEHSHNYVSNPTEVRARLGEIRYNAKNAGIYDPFTEELTPEKFQEYINKKENRGGAFGDLREQYTDEEILWMLNNISKNEDTNQKLDVAKKGGEPKKKKRKTDDYGRYRSEDGNVRTPLTPEMQAVMPPDEWGQYIQELPEVYTTRTKEQQEAINAARNMQLLNELNYQRAPHLYLPDGSLRPQAAQSADWVWQLGTLGAASGLGRSAIGAAESLGSRALPYIEGALNTSIPGMASIPGATIGNAAGAYFAGDAIVNRLYPSAGKIQEGKYGEAAADIATGVLDLYGANMLSPVYKGAKATVSELGKGLYEAGNAGVDLAKTNPQAWFKTPQQILETPDLYVSAMGRTSWKDPVGKLNKFIDDAKIKSSYKRENALLDKYPGFENRNTRIPLQQEEQLKRLQIEKAIEERNLRRSKLPIKQILTEQGTKLGGGQGRIFVNTLNPEEVIKIGTFPGGSEDLANLVQAGKNLEGMPLMENVAFPTKAFTLKTPKVKGNTVIRSNSDAVQFMPWKGNPLDVNNPINKPLGFGVPSDKAKRELQYMAELLDENKVGIDYFGQNNIMYDPATDSYKLVDLNYLDDPKKAWEWNKLDKPVKQRIEDKFGYEIPKEVPKELPGSPNTFKSSLGSMDMSKYEIKNPDYFTQLLNTYDSRRLSNSNKQFYKDLIANVKKQNGIATERQYNELQRLRTGNFNFGKKGYSNGGPINLFENQRPNSKLNKFIR